MADKCDYDVAVIGAGVSGVSALKCVLEAGLSAVCFEKTEHVGGLWHFTEDGYGVMRFTHINVSKYNYCFSDYPFADDVVDHPHNADMQKYIEGYVEHFDLMKHINFGTTVVHMGQQTDNGGVWTIRTQSANKAERTVVVKNVAVATGHHALPIMPSFPGQETFKGELLHSVAYKDAITNGIVDKKPLVIGVGNSGMDVAVDLFARGNCKPTLLSTRSGAWVINNHVFNYATDLYACRLFLWLPWRIATVIVELVTRLTNGNPFDFGLNPSMQMLQTQPSVSGALYFHLRRQNVVVKPNVNRISGNRVLFTDGSSADVDTIVCCTGYRIHLPFIDTKLNNVLLDDESNEISLYKNVFSPSVGASLAFIGFVQPSSGGILSMSETQARWFAQLCLGTVNLPSKQLMQKDIEEERQVARERYCKSTRHTIQRDPIVYNDEIASLFGAKPQFWRHPLLAYRLLLGSCGSAQWRLQGPGTWSGANKLVRSIPVTPLMQVMFWALVLLLAWMIKAVYSVFA
eukprot:scpid37421/ scgid20379/ Dimethylaniline monooxygenase [N-oxide-forming] 5; Dimethylaniline oxidase 5; Hepatic flavin-containing monooxygenase 5